MKRADATVILSGSVEQVWKIVTDNRQYGWRSDLSKIEVSEDGSEFTEYSKKGVATRFRITEKEPMERYAFEMENRYFTGCWHGEFSQTAGGGTKLILSEEMTGKNAVSKLLGVFFNLNKLQERYITDLKMELSKK